MKRMFRRRPAAERPDLQAQFESLLDTVWQCERRAALMRRIEALAAIDERRRPGRDEPRSA